MSNISEGPGIAIISRSDYDGWPVGDPISYIGPFESYEKYQEWHQRYGYDIDYIQWQQLTPPN